MFPLGRVAYVFHFSTNPFSYFIFFQIEKLGDTYYLVKRNAVVADTGKYICLATNELGQAHCSAFIRVIGNWT